MVFRKSFTGFCSGQLVLQLQEEFFLSCGGTSNPNGPVHPPQRSPIPSSEEWDGIPWSHPQRNPCPENLPLTRTGWKPVDQEAQTFSCALRADELADNTVFPDPERVIQSRVSQLSRFISRPSILGRKKAPSALHAQSWVELVLEGGGSPFMKDAGELRHAAVLQAGARKT